MKLQAIRGRNQRGISFVSEESNIPSGIVTISSADGSTLSVLRKYPSVPSDQIVLDKRYYDFLGLNEENEVAVEKSTESIPFCTEFTLQVSSERMLDAKEIIKVFSKKIEDLEPYLDGLILQSEKKYFLDELGVSIRPTSINPISESLDAAIVDWNRVMKVYLEAGGASSKYNLCLVIELGAASRKLDIKTKSGEMADNIPRYALAQEVANLVISGLSNDSSLFYSLAFSTELSHFSQDNPILVTQNLIDAHSVWLGKSLETHEHKASDLGAAIDYAIKISRAMSRENKLPTMILILSSGIYSHGVNPIPVVRNLLSGTEGIFLVCIGLGDRIDLELLEAISEEGNGFMYHMNQRTQLNQASVQIEKWMKRLLKIKAGKELVCRSV